MDLRGLTAFVTVAEELHFTRAAERLGIGQPQMSQLVRRFERDCGATLIERTTRSVHLTPEGKAVLPHAQRAVQEMRLVQRSAILGGGSLVGEVRLGYAGASSRPWLPSITRAVRRAAPGVSLQFRSMVYAASGPGLVVSGDLELAFSRRPLRHPGLEEQLFEYEQVMVGLPSDHPLAEEPEIDLAQLRDEPWVMFPGTRGSTVRDMGFELARDAGFTPRVVQEAPDSYTILGLVAAGVGVTLTLSSVAHVSTPGLLLKPLKGTPIYMAATVVWSAQASRATRAVVDVITEVQPPPPRPSGIVLDGS
ncbi:LysR family transcriptional regulator [Citricoccus sp. NR2]|uniref:LysR family transcriptional regulator n=1 Tax=Citricoccus sp. NR2 TaxID=3004095 RepID=UPI0022DDD2D6|nr:LysR family transcriptional regulator [Citricoccus sp. NR2]WBL19481.1 LysR family transcriptional regulator [Citricoccus sp. NR2]